MKTILATPIRTQDGRYIVDAVHITDVIGNGFYLVRNVGWVKYSNKMAALLIPNVGWVTCWKFPFTKWTKDQVPVTSSCRYKFKPAAYI